MTNQKKLSPVSAYKPSSTASVADNEASMNPSRRPMRRISSVAGIVVAATATTMTLTGSVANAGLSVSLAPIIPPSVTMTMEPVAEIS